MASERRRAKTALLLGAVLALGACEDEAFDFLRQPAQSEGTAEGTAEVTDGSSTSVERDVEAPEVFQTTESGLWDGRPSLGGVWVAHPEVDAPERVLIRNEENDLFVVGALFRRERDVPGPRLQVSSDAAEELEMLAGQPARLNVTALRKETAEPDEAEDVPEDEGAAREASDAEESEAAATPEADGDEVTAAPLDEAETPRAPPTPGSSLDRPYIQIGIFSVEQNARNAATSLRQDGIVPTVREQVSSGKPFWRVIVGPASSAEDRDAILEKVEALGYSDAYFVTD